MFTCEITAAMRVPSCEIAGLTMLTMRAKSSSVIGRVAWAVAVWEIPELAIPASTHPSTPILSFIVALRSAMFYGTEYSLRSPGELWTTGRPTRVSFQPVRRPAPGQRRADPLSELRVRVVRAVAHDGQPSPELMVTSGAIAHLPRDGTG